MAALDLADDVATLTCALVDIESVSLDEELIADKVEAVLGKLKHLEVERVGNSVVASTRLGRAERVVIAGHLDTVPVSGNLPAKREGDRIYGRGACDMKGGVAVALKLARDLVEPNRDLTYVFYDAEEISAVHNGLGKIAAARPELLKADFAILMEPSNAVVEAGCQGTLRVDVVTRGVAAHSARAWTGVNAIHAAAPLLSKLADYVPRKPVIDGLNYHEGLNAVLITGGLATNVIPDECRITVNYRFAPDRSEDEALAFVRDFFEGHEVEVLDSSPGAMPGLGVPAAAAFVESVGGRANPKFGWTDVSRFSAVGVPAVNFGPGDPSYAHKDDEFVEVEQLRECEAVLRRWLQMPEGGQ